MKNRVLALSLALVCALALPAAATEQLLGKHDNNPTVSTPKGGNPSNHDGNPTAPKSHSGNPTGHDRPHNG